MAGEQSSELSHGGKDGKGGLSPKDVSAFFGDTPWSRVTAYLVQNSKLQAGRGMTNKEISSRIMTDFEEDSKANVQRSVDRALVKMAKDGQVVYTADRPRRYRLNQRIKSVREIQRSISDLMSIPKSEPATKGRVFTKAGREDAVFGRVTQEAERLRRDAWRPMTIPPVQRVVIESLVGAPSGWVPRSSIYQRVYQRRPCSQGRVSQVLGMMADLGIIESRREGRNMLFRMGERFTGMDVDQAYDEYRKARSRTRRSRSRGR